MENKPAKNRRPRAAMYACGLTDKIVAEKCQPPVTPMYVSLVVLGYRKGYRVREVIAAETGKSVQDLWPDDADPHLPKAA